MNKLITKEIKKFTKNYLEKPEFNLYGDVGDNYTIENINSIKSFSKELIKYLKSNKEKNNA